MKRTAEQLNRLYNNRLSVPDSDQHLARWSRESARVRKTLIARLDVPYGADGSGAMNQTLDIFPAINSHAPVLVFLHGGYWRSMSKSDHSFVAEPFVHQGACVVVPDYALCPQTEGQVVTLAMITMQMVQALAWVYRNIAKYGGDARRLTVAGHSAGGHLVAMMLLCQWHVFARDLPEDLVRRGISISGIFDLAPIAKTPFLQEALKLTPQDIVGCSPYRMEPPAQTQLQAFVGAGESEVFLEQNQLIRKAWGRQVVPVCESVSLQGQGCHHFSVLSAMLEPSNNLYQGILNSLMR